MLWYGLGRPVITPKIGHWSVFVLFGWRFVFGIIMRWDGREPAPADAITTLGNNKVASLLLLRSAKVSGTKDLLDRPTCQGILLCLHLVTSQWPAVGIKRKTLYEILLILVLILVMAFEKYWVDSQSRKPVNRVCFAPPPKKNAVYPYLPQRTTSQYICSPFSRGLQWGMHSLRVARNNKACLPRSRWDRSSRCAYNVFTRRPDINLDHLRRSSNQPLWDVVHDPCCTCPRSCRLYCLSPPGNVS